MANIWLARAGACALLLGVCVGSSRPASSEESSRVHPPDVARMPVDQAREALVDRGLRLGRVWRLSRARIGEFWPGVDVPVGHVIVQNPKSSLSVARGSAVQLVISADRDGPLPARFRAKSAATPAPETPAPATPPAEDTAPKTHSPAGRPYAVGSPDAPRPAPRPDAQVVPPLLGLHLPAAEQLARDAKMKLYVTRVAGHPVGRVTKQDPGPYEARPEGGVVQVSVTAGGDFAGAEAPAPTVHVDEVVVPLLMDRTGPQAQRILKDLGLIGQVQEDKSGPPGRIVRQRPLPGDRVPRRSLVRVWVGPPKRDGVAPPPEPRAEPHPEPRTPPTTPGEARAALRPIAPQAASTAPRESTFRMPFAWTPVEGASRYLLEVQEADADGNFVGVVLRRVKTTSIVAEIERLDEVHVGALRWRVAAVQNGRRHAPTDWVLLK